MFLVIVYILDISLDQYFFWDINVINCVIFYVLLCNDFENVKKYIYIMIFFNGLNVLFFVDIKKILKDIYVFVNGYFCKVLYQIILRYFIF